MKPYSPSSKAAGSTKGLVGGRKSKATPHRKRCLKRDKAAARREGQSRTTVNPLTGHTETWVGDTQCWPQD